MLTTTLGNYVAQGLGPEAVQAARPVVRAAFQDTVACIVAGRRAAATELAGRWAQAGMPAQDEAGLLFTSARGSVRHAAFLNAVAAHAWEMDDGALASHPSAVLVPVIVAEAERQGVRGDAVVQAYTVAYQVWADLNRRRSRSLHSLGWHPTAVYGPMAAAAAVASLRGLDAPTTAHALGIAASSTGGVVANFGTTTKPIQVGFAAERGVLAVDLASAGVTSAPGALEAPGGLLRALDQSGEEHGFEFVAEPLAVVTSPPTVKKYPICLASHRVVDGVLDLLAEGGWQALDVTSVEAVISEASAAVLAKGQNGPAGIAQFSLEFAVSTALVHGRVGLAEVEPRLVDDPVIRDLMSRVEVRTTDTRSPEEPSFALADRVVVTTADGRRRDSGEIRYVRGGAHEPLRAGELEAKVRACLELGEPDPARRDDIRAAVEEMVAASGTKEKK